MESRYLQVSRASSCWPYVLHGCVCLRYDGRALALQRRWIEGGYEETGVYSSRRELSHRSSAREASKDRKNCHPLMNSHRGLGSSVRAAERKRTQPNLRIGAW